MGGDAVAITVHDTGEGVPEDMKDKLFSPLATGKAKGTTFPVTLPQTVDDLLFDLDDSNEVATQYFM